MWESCPLCGAMGVQQDRISRWFACYPCLTAIHRAIPALRDELRPIDYKDWRLSFAETPLGNLYFRVDARLEKLS